MEETEKQMSTEGKFKHIGLEQLKQHWKQLQKQEWEWSCACLQTITVALYMNQ